MRIVGGPSPNASRDTHSKEPLVSNQFVSIPKLSRVCLRGRRIIGLIAALSVLSLTGCASMVNGSKQSLKIEAVDATTKAPKSATCNVSKPDLSMAVKTSEEFQVKRSSRSLYITCEDGSSIGHLREKSDFAQRFLFLDLATDLCLVSCFIDGYHKAWYEYPSTLVVEMKPAS
ncbi:hypothetical protein [Pseudomonas serbica]|uniref:hypothetical protein n=1 Tax=Pseudomonas serbica TaxID=2965074 RepID=UPI00237AC28C|nr:hypothetical protein [Pseudomonas serbica]